MPKLEIKRKAELSRKEVSERLIAIGQAIARGPDVELTAGDDSLEIVVADRVRWELEIEVDGDKTEIEIEISWHDDAAAESAADTISASPPAVPAKAARRGRARKTTAR
ncbi:amphi-Trp domain-containing protein [Nocardia rhizosphaerihabitans]|uniref:amphi-Trp domain-containing protein n=1 Tax=Nocardia rhizosphaerihabitans TaxID=1691570 RepID=UPI00366D41DA